MKFKTLKIKPNPKIISLATLLEEKVHEYCHRYRRSDLPPFIVHPLHTKENWNGTLASLKPGCYGIYRQHQDDGALAYIGKASLTATIGGRLANHFTYRRPKWLPAMAFVQMVEVSEPFEAPSLEEWLIRELHPEHNSQGLRDNKNWVNWVRRRTAEWDSHAISRRDCWDPAAVP